MKPQIQTHYSRLKHKGEVNNMPSKTIPDQTLSVHEILRRFAVGLPISGSNQVGMYESSGEVEDDDILTDGIDPRTLDLHERHELMQISKQRVEEYKRQQKDLEQKTKAHKLRAAAIKEYEQQLAAKEARARDEKKPSSTL